MHVTIAGKSIPILASPGLIIDGILSFAPFLKWTQRMDHQLKYSPMASKVNLKSILITDVDLFGPRIGFCKFTADLTWPDETRIPGIVFCRGGAVAVLVLLVPPSLNDLSYESLMKHAWTVLTIQPRIPIGCLAEAALPAGMLDGNSRFVGVAAKELEEECGLVIHQDELIDLTPEYSNQELLTTDKACPFDLEGLYPSAGGCDEFIRLYALIKPMAQSELDELSGKQTGLVHEGERITLLTVRLSELHKSTRDMKAFAALALLPHSLASIK